MKYFILPILVFLFSSISFNTMHSETDLSLEERTCTWNFDWNMNEGKKYDYRSTIRVKANPHNRNDIEYMELWINNQFVRKESTYPYEWGNNDNKLRNMSHGTYTLRIKCKDKCGKFHEKSRRIEVRKSGSDDTSGDSSGNSSNCIWDFSYNFNCGTRYNIGKNLYVKGNPQNKNHIDYMELYVNNQFIRKETSYPFEWARQNGSGDNELKNLQPGTYNLKMKVKDTCGRFHEKTCVIYINNSGNGNGNGNGGSTGGSTGNSSNCTWYFSYNFNCGTRYNIGKNLYVKGNPQNKNHIDYMELYVNNQFIRKETSYPFEWARQNGSGDNELKNLQPGTYNLKIKVKDTCGRFHEKTCVIYINNSGNGNGNGNGNGGSTGGSTGNSSNCTWYFSYNFNCGTRYNIGKNLYVKGNPQNKNHIDYMELYVNNQFIRKETSYPFEWARQNGSGDNELKNLQPGTYNLKMKVKDTCGRFHEKTCVIYINNSGNGNGNGNGNGGSTGGSTGNSSNCTWYFSYNFNCGTRYNIGKNLYVKGNPQNKNHIDYMELYVNNQFIRKETSYPFEWARQNGSGDNELKNLQPGTYNLKMKVKDTCGRFHEKTCVIYINNSGNGNGNGNGNGGSTGNSSNCTWYFSYNFNCGTRYNIGKNLYVKGNPQNKNHIDYMELYVNNQFIRKETSYPFEWARQNGSGDNELKNLQPGTYNLRMKVKDTCGRFHEKTCVIYINNSGNGNGNGGNSGNSSNCNWQSSYDKPNRSSYSVGHDLYVNVKAQRHQDIEYMELYFNDRRVRRETNSPYEWGKGSNDSMLKNLRIGTYKLKCKIKDKCGGTHWKEKTIRVTSS